MTMVQLIKRARAIDKIIQDGDVSYEELAEYDGIINELYVRGIISDEVMQDIDNGELGTIDLYIANSN